VANLCSVIVKIVRAGRIRRSRFIDGSDLTLFSRRELTVCYYKATVHLLVTFGRQVEAKVPMPPAATSCIFVEAAGHGYNERRGSDDSL
jgi:hypothetical protein